ncbi:FecCD family ABC transporter permease [Pectinatus cerevisiiphilus]|uniref:Iron complex transport system permease protein n=1 Tax=Pectinatus cerevisiiphilus TaxID=86956 RepID=A0A4R3KHA2_9FIRM|nr:iron ABC transporter permease [Pectinatus cerevisiiphilus]TCS82051.1 iron complex transport system permease protein [Pectinatus cerevisiiphilus]
MKDIHNKDMERASSKQKIFILAGLLILLIISVGVALAQGAVYISPQEIQGALTGNTGANSQIIMNIRLPRTILTVLVGINLATAGAILQAVMKNPLADPHIIGISSGAGIAGIFIMIVLPQFSFLITPAAFVGAMLAALCIYILAWKNGIKPLRIILAGVAVSSFIGAGISALLILYSDRVNGALMWMVGGFAARSWIHVQLILPYTVFGVFFVLLFTRHLNVLLLGDEIARGLGMNVEKTRIILTAAAALLAASAVSVAGLLGFVGLIVPHTARLIIGSDYRFMLPASVLLGGSVVTLSDTVARCAFAPIELPVGIFMAILGVPFFLFLLRREL